MYLYIIFDTFWPENYNSVFFTYLKIRKPVYMHIKLTSSDENRLTFLLKHSLSTMEFWFLFFDQLKWNWIIFYGTPDIISNSVWKTMLQTVVFVDKRVNVWLFWRKNEVHKVRRCAFQKHFSFSWVARKERTFPESFCWPWRWILPQVMEPFGKQA